ncbi:hypothetical protein BJY24_006241 [Nocardia transvalensis]|uniref:Uncharacterized protein n=1 Tax=Nocardia transvalensis TaxID=37333 RepID=A0A7W9ULA0_9NOCA|nr:hypothetical protein [Nocardia transvalensis]MBB5917329.1 hypothetical protein [Nocardia transvalensis]
MTKVGHLDRDIHGYTYSRPTDGPATEQGPNLLEDLVLAIGIPNRRVSDGARDGKEPTPVAVMPVRRVVALVCFLVAVPVSVIAAIVNSYDDNDLEQRLQYQECLTQQQARVAQDGSLLKPEDICAIRKGP